MSNRSVVIVGAGDIAVASALIMREHGYGKVYVLSRGQSHANHSALTRLREAGYHTVALQCDMSDWASIAEATSVIDHRVDSIVYSPAGQRVFKELEELSQSDWNQSLDVFVGGLIGTLKALLPNIGRGTTIVALSGTSARTVVSSRHLAMGSAKAALEHAVAYLSNALAPLGARINGIACGPVDTSSNRDALSIEDMESLRSWQSSLTLPGRLGQPEDIGRIVDALCGPAFEWMTGEVILADGGALSRSGGGSHAGNPLDTLLEPKS